MISEPTKKGHKQKEIIMKPPIFELPLKVMRHLYLKMRPKPYKENRGIGDADVTAKLIYDLLKSDKPIMIGRLGSTELGTLQNYLGIRDSRKQYFKYISGNCEQWWWNKNLMQQMQNWSGFFPPDEKHLTKFCEALLKDISEVDVLGSWLYGERTTDQYRAENSKNTHLRLLEPFWSEIPWTKALEGKKVLVIHPFEEEIITQYKRKEKLFEKEILPEFELHTIKAVQSLGNEKNSFSTWFEALKWMQEEMDKTDYDVCLVGAGAYGFPLAAHAKRSGKKAVHLGGSLQLLFGIIGSRWEDPNYGVKEWGIHQGSYSNLINKHWIRPGETTKPLNAEQVEGACYW